MTLSESRISTRSIINATIPDLSVINVAILKIKANYQETTMNKTKIKKTAFVSVYVKNFEQSYKFYNEVLGLEKEFDMGELACFFKLGEDSGLYLQGGNKKIEYKADTMRTAFVLTVESASAMYEKLKAEGMRFVHKAPVQMGPKDYWFMFYDPAGNILEILGGE